eukprot:Pompholyxophrys_punicea_v1_NODE_269_length_2443_cov_3.185930.p1 type:complete len:262 gc:universal NODE_269_length_2443_cov_3.185930:2356-1571(-)
MGVLLLRENFEPSLRKSGDQSIHVYHNLNKVLCWISFCNKEFFILFNLMNFCMSLCLNFYLRFSETSSKVNCVLQKMENLLVDLVVAHIREKNYTSTICSRSFDNSIVILNTNIDSKFFAMRLVVKGGRPMFLNGPDQCQLPESWLHIELGLMLQKFVDFINGNGGINIEMIENSELLKLDSKYVRSVDPVCLQMFKPSTHSKSELCPSCTNLRRSFVRKIRDKVSANLNEKSADEKRDPSSHVTFSACSPNSKLARVNSG